jgi:hypothetical protein
MIRYEYVCCRVSGAADVSYQRRKADAVAANAAEIRRQQAIISQAQSVQASAKALYEEEAGKRATGVCVCVCVCVGGWVGGGGGGVLVVVGVLGVVYIYTQYAHYTHTYVYIIAALATLTPLLQVSTEEEAQEHLDAAKHSCQPRILCQQSPCNGRFAPQVLFPSCALTHSRRGWCPRVRSDILPCLCTLSLRSIDA